MSRLLCLILLPICLPACAQISASSISQANLDAASAYHLAHKGEAMIVQQNGKNLFIKFSAGYNDGLHTLASGTKSFSCAIEAFAEADGLLKLDEPASNTITDWQTDNRKTITIGDLLSLESGLTSDGIIGAGKVRTMDTYAAAVARPAIRAPRQTFIYDPLNFQDFAMILQVKTGGTYAAGGHVTGGTDPVAYLQQKLFTPLGIDAGHPWVRDAAHHPQMAGGASLHATEWIKYGQLMLDGGKWNGKQLIDPKLLARCHDYSAPAYAGYGLTFWLNRPSGKRYSSAKNAAPRDAMPEDTTSPSLLHKMAPHAPADMYMAAGLGKQRLYIIPSLGLVIERLAPLSSEEDKDGWSDDRFLALLLGTAN